MFNFFKQYHRPDWRSWTPKTMPFGIQRCLQSMKAHHWKSYAKRLMVCTQLFIYKYLYILTYLFLKIQTEHKKTVTVNCDNMACLYVKRSNKLFVFNNRRRSEKMLYGKCYWKIPFGIIQTDAHSTTLWNRFLEPFWES